MLPGMEPFIALVRVAALVLALAAFAIWAFLTKRYLPKTEFATCARACISGCTPARASLLFSACGCAGDGWPRYVGRAGFVRRLRCLTACSIHARTQCSWAALITGMGCMCR